MGLMMGLVVGLVVVLVMVVDRWYMGLVMCGSRGVRVLVNWIRVEVNRVRIVVDGG